MQYNNYINYYIALLSSHYFIYDAVVQDSGIT